MPYLLFSQMKTTGSFQIAARLTASWNAPSLAAPSPKKLTTTRSSPLHLVGQRGAGGDRDAAGDDAVGAEVAGGDVGDVHRAAAAAAVAGLLGRAARPSSASRSAPLAMQWPWPRWVEVIASSVRSARQAPVADASWPIERCMVPCIRPRANRSSTASSNRRVVHMVRSAWRAWSGPATGELLMKSPLHICAYVSHVCSRRVRDRCHGWQEAAPNRLSGRVVVPDRAVSPLLHAETSPQQRSGVLRVTAQEGELDDRSRHHRGARSRQPGEPAAGGLAAGLSPGRARGRPRRDRAGPRPGVGGLPDPRRRRSTRWATTTRSPTRRASPAASWASAATSRSWPRPATSTRSTCAPGAASTTSTCRSRSTTCASSKGSCWSGTGELRPAGVPRASLLSLPETV